MRRWLPVDLAASDCAEQVAKQMVGTLDALVHNAGVWEPDAFRAEYRFENGDVEQDRWLMQVNLLAPLALTRALLPFLRQATQPKIILIGSVNGLENSGYPEVTYTASKAGLRGMAHALREHLRADKIPVTIINCGTLGDTWRNAAGDVIGAGIPWEDLANLVRCVLAVSNRTAIKEIHVPAMDDPSV